MTIRATNVALALARAGAYGFSHLGRGNSIWVTSAGLRCLTFSMSPKFHLQLAFIETLTMLSMFNQVAGVDRTISIPAFTSLPYSLAL